MSRNQRLLFTAQRAAVAGFSGRAFVLAAALLTFFAATLFALAVGRGLNIDEHGFVSTGVLLAREGSLPFRDYAWVHTPNLTFLYALAFRFSDHLLLSARALSVLCTLGMLGLVAFAAWRELGQYPERTRSLLVLGAVLLLFSNPLTRYVCWRAWNHPPAVLLATAAIVCLWRGASLAASRWWFFFGGFFVALAVGTRLTAAPLAVGLVAVTLIAGGGTGFRGRLARAFALSAGAVIGALPMLWMLTISPDAFVFGVFTWHGPVSQLFRVATDGAEQITTATRLLFPIREVLSNPGNLALLLLFVALQVAAFRHNPARAAGDFSNLLVLVSVICALAGALAPSTPYHQHYYAAVPLLVLGLIPPLRLLSQRTAGLRDAITWIFAAAVAVSLASTWHDYKHLKRVASPATWTPLKIHAAGQQLATLAPSGRVLTVAPITPLEGRLRIYPAFVNGHFGWRTAPFIPEQQRHAFGFVGPDELSAMLAGEPPVALCTGNIDAPEQAFLDYAASRGYQPHKLANGETAWVPSQR
jgi:hypothetical protein